MYTLGQNTQTTPTYYEPDLTSGDLEQHQLRVLIDEVATLRGLTIQMSLRLMALVAAPTGDDRVLVCSELKTLQEQFAQNMDMLFGSSVPPAKNRHHIEWIRKTIGRDTERSAELLKVEANIQKLVAYLDDGKIPSFDEARNFFDRNWPIVRDKMTEIIWDLWADLDQRRSDAIEKNAALQNTLQETLADIKKVSAAIRMIAINTSIMAARPQDSGAGFKAISLEVKLLSENIDASTSRAQETISRLT